MACARVDNPAGRCVTPPLQVAIKIYHHYAAISHQVFECIQQTGAYRRRLHNLRGGGGGDGAKIYIFILAGRAQRGAE
jgi:hypothetical protein